MDEIVFFLFLIGFVPPTLALMASFKTRDRIATFLLRYGSLYFLTMFTLYLIMSADCAHMNRVFRNCGLAPEGFTAAFTAIHPINLQLYLFAAPAIAAVALFSEVRARINGR